MDMMMVWLVGGVDAASLLSLRKVSVIRRRGS